MTPARPQRGKRKEKEKDTVKFSISCDNNWKRMTRPRFHDVVEKVYEQLDDLGHDLDGAIIVALPKGASPRQVLRALWAIEDEQKSQTVQRVKLRPGDTVNIRTGGDRDAD